MSIHRRISNCVVRTLQVILFLSVCAIVAGCDATEADLTPILDPTQRFEFEGFSILPPRANGWNRLIWMEQQQPKVFSNIPVRALSSVRAYFIKRLSEEITSPSDVHRLTAVVRALNVDDLEDEDSVSFLKGIADSFSGETFLDNCFKQDCMRYQSTSEVSNSNFPDSVFIINKHGFFVLHPASPTLVINVEYRQYYAQGEQPLPAEDLEREVEPFQNSLEFASTPPVVQSSTSDRWSAHYDQGLTYLQKGELNEAISEFNKALDLIRGLLKFTTIEGLPITIKASLRRQSLITQGS